MDDETRQKIARDSRAIAQQIATLLRQELKIHKGQWWLYSLDKPQRPLSEEEVREAKARGRIPE
jgi:hypothetical protein